MRCFIGIDLGSTTTKAVVIDEQQNVLGRGITNSRSNYDTAAAVAKTEALINGRFHLFRGALQQSGALNGSLESFIGQLERDFRAEQYLEQLVDLEATCRRNLAHSNFSGPVAEALDEVFKRLTVEAPALFAPGARRKSDFFRDIAGSQYLAAGEAVAKSMGLRYDFLLNLFDRSIIEVENRVYADSVRRHLMAALEQEILAVWPRERIVAPEDVQGDADGLSAGLAARGWPTIDASRGKLLLVLHDAGFWRDKYVEAGLAGHLLFPDAFGDLTLPYAAVHTLNDPTGDAAKIAAALAAGHLVRTRADSDNVEPLAGDYTRATAALASGATFISTDYPPPKGEVDFVFAIPEGTPSRCNPVTAPGDCAPAEIEDL